MLHDIVPMVKIGSETEKRMSREERGASSVHMVNSGTEIVICRVRKG